jgi:hypothetical protein
MMPDSDDFVLAYMRKHNIKLTRQNYLDLSYLGDPPEHLDAEFEVMLPLRFQKKSRKNR